MQKKIKFLIIMLAVAVIVPQVTFASWYNPISWGWLNRIFHFQQIAQKEQKQNQTVCTMEAKLCPDGSYVGRSGPKCEFEACSTTNAKDPIVDWKKYTNTQYGFELSYPSDWFLRTFELNGNSMGDTIADIRYENISFEIFGNKPYNTRSLLPSMCSDSQDSKITINGTKVLRTHTSLEAGTENSLGLNFCFYPKNGDIVIVHCVGDFPGVKLIESCNQVISTFKFIK